jgi:hypothetical protein
MKWIIEILQKELAEYKKVKQKSIESFEKNEISKELHETHIKNITPKIVDLIFAIKILEIEFYTVQK